MKPWVMNLEVLFKYATRALTLMAHEKMLYGIFAIVT